MSSEIMSIEKFDVFNVEGGDLLQTYIKGKKTEIICLTIPNKKAFINGNLRIWD